MRNCRRRISAVDAVDAIKDPRGNARTSEMRGLWTNLLARSAPQLYARGKVTIWIERRLEGFLYLSQKRCAPQLLFPFKKFVRFVGFATLMCSTY